MRINVFDFGGLISLIDFGGSSGFLTFTICWFSYIELLLIYLFYSKNGGAFLFLSEISISSELAVII